MTDAVSMVTAMRTKQEAVQALPLGIAVLCRDCATPVPLVLFVGQRTPMRQVRCPGCDTDVVLRDAW
jgi:hypothetical protein